MTVPTKGGAPKGSSNRANGAQFKNSLEKALKKKSRLDRKIALDEIAMVLVEKALTGDLHAAREIIDRLDGKAAQQINTTGGAPVFQLVIDTDHK